MPDRVDDRVVVASQVLDADVAAELDVPEEAQARVLGGALVQPRHRLDLRVVGRDAGAHEPPRRRQPLVEVDVQLGLGVAQQVARRVGPGGAGADDRDADAPLAHAGAEYTAGRSRG